VRFIVEESLFLSNRTLSLDDRTYEYLLSVSVDESELLRELREETAGDKFSVMQISPEQGQFMALLVKLTGAKRALEIGTFTGYSSICIANALPEDGELVCCDDSDEWTQMARKYWQKAGLQDKIQFHLQAASVTLQALLDDSAAGSFDFIFVDADKQNYPLYYEQSLKLLRKGGLLAVDNTLWSGSVADPDNMEPGTRAIRRFNEMVKNDNRVTKSLVPIGDGLTLILKDFE
jgi:predicted O-methyltransferase YrrM